MSDYKALSVMERKLGIAVWRVHKWLTWPNDWYHIWFRWLNVGSALLLPLMVFANILSNAVRACFSCSDLVEFLVSFSSGLRQKHDSARHEYTNTNTCTSVSPSHVVMLPMRHPVTSITPCTECDDSNQPKYCCNLMEQNQLNWSIHSIV